MFSFSIVYVCSAQPELATPKARLAFAKRHHFPGRFSGHHFLALASLTSGDALRRITSPDVLSGLTSCRRQPCDLA